MLNVIWKNVQLKLDGLLIFYQAHAMCCAFVCFCHIVDAMVVGTVGQKGSVENKLFDVVVVYWEYKFSQRT